MAKNYVCNGAKVECLLCSKPQGTLMVTSNQVKVQDKFFATEADNTKANFIFEGTCIKSPNGSAPCIGVIIPNKWMNTADALIQDNKALLEDSIIMCDFGGVPIRIVDDKQIHQPTELLPIIAPVILPVPEPKIISVEWKSNITCENEREHSPDQVIDKNTMDTRNWVEVTTLNVLPGEEVTIDLTGEIKE